MTESTICYIHIGICILMMFLVILAARIYWKEYKQSMEDKQRNELRAFWETLDAAEREAHEKAYARYQLIKVWESLKL